MVELGHGPAGFHLTAACTVNSSLAGSFLLLLFFFRFCFVLRKTRGFENRYPLLLSIINRLRRCLVGSGLAAEAFAVC